MEVYKHNVWAFVMVIIAVAYSHQTLASPLEGNVVSIAGGHDAHSPSLGVLITSSSHNSNSLPPPVIFGPRPTSRPVIFGPIPSSRPVDFGPRPTPRPFTGHPGPWLGCYPGSPFYPWCLYRG